MLTEISAALGSLKATNDILKGLNAAVGEAKLNEVKIQLQRTILDAMQALNEAQVAQAGAEARTRGLEQEIVRLKDWSAERQRYQLRDVGGGAFVYVQKPGMEDGEPPHWLCAKCFNDGHKSFLQNKGNGVGNRTTAERGLDNTYACGVCRSGIQVRWSVDPASDRAKMISAG